MNSALVADRVRTTVAPGCVLRRQRRHHEHRATPRRGRVTPVGRTQIARYRLRPREFHWTVGDNNCRTDGLAVGLDISVPMLTRAVLDNSGPRTCYVRGDAGTLPFGDETFDAVCCFGALYLMPEPFQVAREMVRVLRPGGRVAILTSYAGQTPPVRHAMTASARRHRAAHVRSTRVRRPVHLVGPRRRGAADPTLVAVRHRRQARVTVRPASRNLSVRRVALFFGRHYEYRVAWSRTPT